MLEIGEGVNFLHFLGAAQKELQHRPFLFSQQPLYLKLPFTVRPAPVYMFSLECLSSSHKTCYW